jgi:sterol desaturase/sphingolipid hydroxylase (fatty acid hydroxylase superfamily)
MLVWASTWWPYSSAEEQTTFLLRMNFTGLQSIAAILAVYLVASIVCMSSITATTWRLMKWWYPSTPSLHLAAQLKTISVNMVLLPAYQTLWDYFAVLGYTKQTTGNLSPLLLLRDGCLWVLVFEWAWYFQHRLMHDNKFLWTFGHSYHHTWKKPEHMIGITNFAFDHVVETWVTMSSSLLPVLLFPINFYWAKLLGFAYMIFAMLVHWDAFEFSRYHVNHHYLVTKNYGSHVPIFDMLFGTYAWDGFTPKDRY